MNSRMRERMAAALPAYDLGGELGRGSWGVVFAGTHRDLGRPVAIKLLPRAFAADPLVRARFVREARVAARLVHPHIVPVYDFVGLADGACLIVMERCDRTIAELAAQRRLTAAESCRAAHAALLALEHAHGHDVLHRDVKPENLLLDERGVVKLADFGIARDSSENVRLTATGAVMGTPAYMSPEQASGGRLDATSDVYSTGVVLYELLSGHLPFEGARSIGALIRAHLVEVPAPLSTITPEISGALTGVVDRALAKDPSERWATAADFADALTAACEGELDRDRFRSTAPQAGAERTTVNEVVGFGGVAPAPTVVTGAAASGGAGTAFLRLSDRSRREIHGRVIVGRDVAAGICIDESSISRRHAELVETNEGWMITDLGSTNGTYLNGVAVSSAVLRPGDGIRLGGYELSFEVR